jgi:hypothetical protein
MPAGTVTGVALATVVAADRLETVLLHELLHGLGVIEHVDQDAGKGLPAHRRGP